MHNCNSSARVVQRTGIPVLIHWQVIAELYMIVVGLCVTVWQNTLQSKHHTTQHTDALHYAHMHAPMHAHTTLYYTALTPSQPICSPILFSSSTLMIPSPSLSHILNTDCMYSIGLTALCSGEQVGEQDEEQEGDLSLSILLCAVYQCTSSNLVL